jgi:hypothetical protein
MRCVAFAAIAAFLLSGCAWAARDYTTNQVTITVLDRDGTPVAGASVRCWSDTWGHFQPWSRHDVAKTDANGRVQFPMIVGEWSIFAAADGLYLADVRHQVTRDTQEITVRPTGVLTVDARDLDGSPLPSGDLYIYTMEQCPAVPLMLGGHIVDGKAEIAIISGPLLGVLLARDADGDRPALALQREHVIDRASFEPKEPELRRLTIRARGGDDGPGDLDVKVFFPELALVNDYRGNRGVFTLHVHDGAVLLSDPLYIGIDAELVADGWRYRYYPDHFDMQKDWRGEVTYGGAHSIVPKVYEPPSFGSCTWIRTQDAYGHFLHEVRKPDGKHATSIVRFCDKNGNQIYGGEQAGTVVRFDRDLPREVTSWDGSIDYGPLGKREFSGDPRSDEFAYRIERMAAGPHFEIFCPPEPEFKQPAETMVAMMEDAWRVYKHYWHLTPLLNDKPVTIYFQPHLDGMGGGTYGNKEISVWLPDLLLFTDPNRNPAGHIQSILYHEYFHVLQDTPVRKWEGRNLYLTGWYGESFPQVAFNRIYELLYGKNVAKFHHGQWIDGFMRRQAGENRDGNKDTIWDEISYDAGGDDVHLRMFDMVGDSGWKGWDWMTKSGVDERTAVLACYEHLTGKNYAYMARLAGDTDISDDAVDAAAAIIKTGVSPFPEKCEAPFVTEWIVLGPFDDARHRFMPTEQVAHESDLHPTGGQTLLGKTWTPLTANADGFVDLQSAFGPVENVGAFAFTTVNASRAGKAFMWFGPDDGARVWINSSVVIDKDIPNSPDPERYIVPIELREGPNSILIKINNGAATWGFYLRITGPDGKPVVEQ